MEERKGGSSKRRSIPNVRIDGAKTKYKAPGLTLLRGVLGKTLEKYGLDRDIARYQFVLYWKNIVGAAAAERAQPECIRGNTLVVRVSNSAWAQELSFQKATILARLRKYSGDAAVSDVRFYVA